MKIYKGLLFFIFLVLLSSVSLGYTITKFHDDTESGTVNLEVIRNITGFSNDATFYVTNLTLYHNPNTVANPYYNGTPRNYIHQQTANSTAVDGTGGYMYANYTKPDGLVDGAEWGVRHGFLALYNTTMLDSCFDYDPDTLQLRLRSYRYTVTLQSDSWGECYNGSWITITNTESSSGSASASAGSETHWRDGDYNTGSFCTNQAFPACGATGGGNATTAIIYEEEIYWRNVSEMVFNIGTAPSGGVAMIEVNLDYWTNPADARNLSIYNFNTNEFCMFRGFQCQSGSCLNVLTTAAVKINKSNACGDLDNYVNSTGEIIIQKNSLLLGAETFEVRVYNFTTARLHNLTILVNGSVSYNYPGYYPENLTIVDLGFTEATDPWDFNFTNNNTGARMGYLDLEFSYYEDTLEYADYVEWGGNNYTRNLNYTFNLTDGPATYTLVRYINGVNDLNHSVSVTGTNGSYSNVYTHASEGEYNISWNVIWDNWNYSIGNVAFISDLEVPAVNLSAEAVNAFNNENITLNLTCIDSIMPNLTYNLSFNHVTLFTGNNSNNTVQSNASTMVPGDNVLFGSCADLFNTTSSAQNISIYYRNFALIDERENTAFDVTNLSSVKLYFDDNSTYYDFKVLNDSSVNFTSINNTKLRLELITFANDIIIRYIDVTLTDGSARLCANKDDVVHYEQLIISAQQKEAIVTSVFANCLIAADYTRFAYQDAYVLKAYSINTMYYLTTIDSDGDTVTLASIDGSIQSYINIDTLEFQLNAYDIGFQNDAVFIEKSGTNQMLIYYNNTANDNSDLAVTITREDTGEVVYSNSDFADNNGFTIYLDYSTYTNLTNQTLFEVAITKTNAGGTSTIRKYFNTNAAFGFIPAGVAVAIAFLLTVFGLTFTVSRDTFGWFGLFVILLSIAVLSFAVPAWYKTFMLAIEVIIGVFITIMLVTKNYPTVS